MLTTADFEKFGRLVQEKLTPDCAHWLATGETAEATYVLHSMRYPDSRQRRFLRGMRSADPMRHARDRTSACAIACTATCGPVIVASSTPMTVNPAAAASITGPGDAPPAPAGSKCTWCGALLDGHQVSCPQCGATTGIKQLTTDSHWSKLPGRKDMAKLQFGNSFCQIEGKYTPVADMNLAAGDGIYFTHHVLLWKDPQIQITTMPLKGAWKRMFAGMPLIMTQAEGPGHIAFSHDSAGELIALPLHPGQSVDVREHLFLTATSSIVYDWFQTNVWFTTRDNNNDTETRIIR